MEVDPRPSRPHMDDYGVPQGPEGMLPWEWASEGLRLSHNYWLTTTHADGRPHAMPVWGVWLDGAWYCCTAVTSRKARNLAETPHCVVCNEGAAEAVILEGLARRLLAAEIPGPLSAAYKAKYGWELQGSVFEIRPRVVFAMPEQQFPKGATRWNFE
jgi:nitroimidazol reductase NimA-like FMN-containing flavoprotein (pyridoxamine 5'-phosphate oxidase superfamily)